MSRDHALLMAARLGLAPATVRFYDWSEPTVSLGACQRFADWLAVPPPAGALPVVRRCTGGGAILHAAELTYSLVLPRAYLPEDSPGCLYRLVHSAIVQVLNAMDIPAQIRCGVAPGEVLKQREIFWCFERRYNDDVVVRGMKIAGSAQQRYPEAVLQHGSIILARRFCQQSAAAVSDFVPSPRPTAFCNAIIAAIERAAGLNAEEGTWLPAERQLGEKLLQHHKSSAWLRRR